MPNIKKFADLARKAIPKIKEAVEVAKDMASDVKHKGKIYKSTGHNLTEIRRLFETDSRVKAKAVHQGLTRLNEVMTRVPSLPDEGRILDRIQDTTAMALNNPAMERLTSKVRQSIETLPKHSRPRQLFANKLRQDRQSERYFNDLASAVEMADPAFHLQTLEESMSPGFRGVMDDIANGTTNFRREVRIPGTHENVTNEGFEQYLKNKYKR